MNTSAAPVVLRASTEYHLLVTRDTVLDGHAISHLLACAARIARHDPAPVVVVGATRCPKTGELATSALNRKGPRARTYMRVAPTMACLPVDTFDPNCLLVPDQLLRHFGKGPLTASLGLRLRRQGVNIFLAPGSVGTCPPVVRAGAARRRPGFASGARI